MPHIPLDIRTLSFITVLFGFGFGFWLIAFAHTQRVFPGLRTAGQGMVVTGFGFFLIGLRDYAPLAVTLVLANTCILVGFVLVNDGICLFRGRKRTSRPLMLALLLAFLAAFSHASYVAPSLPLKILIICLALALVSGLSCRNMLVGEPGRATLPQKTTALGFALFGAYMLFRAVWVMNEEGLQDFMSAGAVHGLAFLAMICILIQVAYGLIWMANDSLQEELGTYERIISATPDMVVLVDGRGAYKMVNDAVLRVLGVTREAILGRSSTNMFGEEFFNAVTRPNLEKALRGEVCATSRWFDTPESGRRYISLHYHPVPDAEGAISLVAISARDMTELQIAQEERQRIFTMSLDMLCVADADGYFKELNPAWEATLGWDRETLMRSQWIDFVHPDDVQATAEVGKTLTAGAPVVDFVNRYRTRDGSYRFLSWTSHPDPSSRLIYAVARDVTERMEMEEKLKQQATHDPLTGAGNRRLFMQRAGEEIERSVRYGVPLSLLMLDIDHFKAINDTYGHDAGDQVLKELVVETREQLRVSDVFCRLGGEEFAALLINADAQSAETLAERIRQALAGLTVANNGIVITFTVSVGCTERAAGSDSVEAMLKRADSALYAAKQGGRNQVRMA
ncbi:MAG: diguanylate cyclase [Thermodesulfobacteriota bacterium]